jgi:hypothetical protein
VRTTVDVDKALLREAMALANRIGASDVSLTKAELDKMRRDA